MTSAIDATKPESGQAYTADVRANFATARDEITALQADVALLKARQMPAASMVTPNPPNTNSPAFITAGIGVQFTPPESVTRMVVTLEGALGNTGNGNESELQLVFGTGTAPLYGTLVSNTNGELVGNVIPMLAAKPGDYAPFATSVLLTDLVADQLYWLGVGFRAVGGTATLSQMSLIAFGLLDPIP